MAISKKLRHNAASRENRSGAVSRIGWDAIVTVGRRAARHRLLTSAHALSTPRKRDWIGVYGSWIFYRGGVLLNYPLNVDIFARASKLAQQSGPGIATLANTTAPPVWTVR